MRHQPLPSLPRCTYPIRPPVETNSGAALPAPHVSASLRAPLKYRKLHDFIRQKPDPTGSQNETESYHGDGPHSFENKMHHSGSFTSAEAELRFYSKSARQLGLLPARCIGRTSFVLGPRNQAALSSRKRALRRKISLHQSLFKSSSAGVTDRQEPTTVNSFCALRPARNAKLLLSQNILMELLLEQHSLCLCAVRMA